MKRHNFSEGVLPGNSPIEHHCSGGTQFKATADLSEFITIVPDNTGWSAMLRYVLKDFMEFGAWHAMNIGPRLNGFQGYDCHAPIVLTEYEFSMLPCGIEELADIPAGLPNPETAGFIKTAVNDMLAGYGDQPLVGFLPFLLKATGYTDLDWRKSDDCIIFARRVLTDNERDWLRQDLPPIAIYAWAVSYMTGVRCRKDGMQCFGHGGRHSQGALVTLWEGNKMSSSNMNEKHTYYISKLLGVDMRTARGYCEKPSTLPPLT